MRGNWLDNTSWAMAEVYASVTDRILINLAHFFPYVQQGSKIPGSWEYQSRMLAQMGQVSRETVQIIADSLGGADAALRDAISAAIMEGLRTEEPALRRAAAAGLLQTPVNPTVQPGMMQAFQAYYRQSADKLNLVNTVMLESTQEAYAATVADVANRIRATQSTLNIATGEVVSGVSTYNGAIRTAVNRMVENNLTGFIDHAGRHWTPEAYVAMGIRTTTANAARAAVWERNAEYGNDLYLVSSHDGARPLCFPWQGKIISSSGRRGTTTDLDGNTYTVHSEDEIESFRYGGGLFGVNCGHYAMVFIPGFSTMKGQPQDEEDNAKTYAKSQQQRALERKLREEKRDLEVMKAQGAPDEQIRAQRQRVRDASAEIDDFCEQTGRTRRRDREGAPVRATWPGAGGDVTRYNRGYIGTGEVPPPKRVPRAASTTAATPAAPLAPVALTIATATNMADLCTAAERAFGATVSDSVKQLDFGTVQQALTGIQGMAEDFPEIADKLQSITTSASGVMACNGGRITFNPAYFTTPDKIQDAVARMTQRRWWVQNASPASIGTHEAAHALEWFFDTHNPAYMSRSMQVDAWNRCTEAKGIVSQACRNIKRTAFGQGRKNRELLETISGYATSNASESMAEAFADAYANGANASPLSVEIVRLAVERYRFLGGAGRGR